MSRSFYATRDDYDSSGVARRAQLDLITAAMLTGGASGGWSHGRGPEITSSSLDRRGHT